MHTLLRCSLAETPMAPACSSRQHTCRRCMLRKALSEQPSAAGPASAEQSMNSSVLDYADQELQNLCAAKPTPEEQKKCWECGSVFKRFGREVQLTADESLALQLTPGVYEYYHETREQAQAGCSLELHSQGKEGTACQKLDSLGRLVWEVAYTGDAEQLRHVLETEHKVEQKHAAGVADDSPPLDVQTVLDRLKGKAMQLFTDIDTDGNGVIDREEFLNAMKLLEHALSDHEMQLVFGCMDSNGCITTQQFVDIVQAEALQDPSADAEMLRATPHSRPDWWTETPACVSDV